MVCTSCLWRDRTGKRKQCRRGEKQRRNPAFGRSMGVVMSSEQKPENVQRFRGGRGPFIQHIGWGCSECIWTVKEKWLRNGHTQTEVWITEEVNFSQP